LISYVTPSLLQLSQKLDSLDSDGSTSSVSESGWEDSDSRSLLIDRRALGGRLETIRSTKRSSSRVEFGRGLVTPSEFLSSLQPELVY